MTKNSKFLFANSAAKPADTQQRKAMEAFYAKVQEEAVPKTAERIQNRQRNALRVRANSIK